MNRHNFLLLFGIELKDGKEGAMPVILAHRGFFGSLSLHNIREAISKKMLCKGMQREGVKASPDLASGLFCYAPLRNIWDGIQ
jgi:hypothetical protein